MTNNNATHVNNCNIIDASTLDSSIRKLLQNAVEVRKMAYTPYSNFKVGACLLCDDGSVYTGCNVENASIGLTICAEKTAYCKAISEGKTKFKAIAVVAYQENFLTPPCGGCRQFLVEFGNVDIYVAKPQLEKVLVTNLHNLLPFSFEQNPDKSY